MKKTAYYLILLFLLSCSTSPNEKSNNESLSSANPLDSIFGDKIIAQDKNTIRHNNFEKLDEITFEDLCSESNQYIVESKNGSYFILKQRKNYSEARQFNIIFKVQNEKITDHFIIQDFSIKDLVVINNELFLLCDDWDNHNIFWKSKQQILIICFDESYNEQWKYQLKSRFPLQADRIETEGNSIKYIINVITGCHICYSIAELELSSNGKFKSVEEIGTNNSSSIEQKELTNIFNTGK